MVSVTSTRRAASTYAAPAPAPRQDARGFLAKWLKIWVGLLCAVTLVVVVYLTWITNSLADINGNLGTVSREVSGAGSNTAALPGHVDTVNSHLANIDGALQPIPGQAGEVVAALTSINDKLAATDASLVDTSATLEAVLGGANAIGQTLVDADEPADNMGVQDIHQRIAAANGAGSPVQGSASAGGTPGAYATGGNLSAVKGDTGVIVGGLDSINGHLTGACRSLLISLLASGGNC